MVRQYIHDYNDGGLVQIQPKKKPGRTAKFSLSKDQWEEILHQSPCLFEKLQTANHIKAESARSLPHWTLQLLAVYIKEYHGVSMSLSGIWYQLRKAKISMGRSKLRIPCKDAEYTVKRQRVEALKKKAQDGDLTSNDVTIVDPGLMPITQRREAVLIYFDETDLHWCPDTGKGYQVVGAQEKIDSPGQDEVWYLMGGVAYPTSEGLYQIYDRKRTIEVESYLCSIVSMFSEKFIFLIWDNAKTHTTDMLSPFFEEYRNRICPVFLPTYSPLG